MGMEVLEIVKNKRRCKCSRCRGEINNLYKAKFYDKIYHLNCLNIYFNSKLREYKELLRRLRKKKKYFILDGLESR